MIIKQVPAHPSNYTRNSYMPKYGFVIHWTTGKNLESTDRTFQTPNSGKSAHYGVGEMLNGTIEIHQYVQDKYYAWANGNNNANRRYISIEHVGGYVKNKKFVPPTYKTLDASVELIVSKCKEYGIKKLEHKVNIFRHNEVSDEFTECCGTTDIDYIINKVNNILNPNNMDDIIAWNEAIKNNGLTLNGLKVLEEGKACGIVDSYDDPASRKLLEIWHEVMKKIQNDPLLKNNSKTDESAKRFAFYLKKSVAV